MPQVRSRAALSDGFEKGSIAHKAADYSGTNRRVQALGEMEKKTMALKLKLISKNAKIQLNRWTRTEKRLKESLKRNIAYGRVTKEHNISKLMGGPHYKAALDKNYTYRALRFDLLKMLNRMEPSNMRQENSRKKIDIARDQVQDVISRNLASLATPRTNRREEARREREKKEEELRRGPEEDHRTFKTSDPLPPIENNLVGFEPGSNRRELTLVQMPGVTGKAHFKKPGAEIGNSPKTSTDSQIRDITQGVADLKMGPKKVLPAIAT